MQKPSRDDEQHAEDQEADVPGQRSSEIITDVVDLQYLMIDQSFHNVKNSPPHENQPEMEVPIRCQPSPAPAGNGGDRGGQDEEPHHKVEESVGKGVCFEPRDRVGRVFTGVSQHVMPLEDLMEDDAIDKPAKTQPV
ncbi:MAG: hypothetical protein QOH40_2535 [Arthrobacter pascens]|nr:hypothetical protein [Arthrobacter pascens]